MGRTNPTYRDALRRHEETWQRYRRALRHDDQEHFDRLFERAANHADAAGHANTLDAERITLFSMLLAHEAELAALRARLEE